MIANNYRRHADALIAQMELDLSGTVGTCEVQRAAWWKWLMTAGVPQAVERPVAPAWWVALKTASKRLAACVKRACVAMF